VAVAEWVLGNRYVQTMLSGFTLGDAWSGIAYAGYDTIAKKYVATYMDSGGTGMDWFTGSMSPDGKSGTLAATSYDAITLEPVKTELRLRITPSGDHVTEVWQADRSGKMVKTIELQYTRRSRRLRTREKLARTCFDARPGEGAAVSSCSPTRLQSRSWASGADGGRGVPHWAAQASAWAQRNTAAAPSGGAVRGATQQAAAASEAAAASAAAASHAAAAPGGMAAAKKTTQQKLQELQSLTTRSSSRRPITRRRRSSLAEMQ
jgi:hypothetical protein